MVSTRLCRVELTLRSRYLTPLTLFFFFLGSRNIKHSYSTLESTSKKLEISEQKVLSLLSGEKDLINLKYWKKSFTITQKRLEMYIFSFAKIVANRFNSDYNAGVGFFE